MAPEDEVAAPDPSSRLAAWAATSSASEPPGATGALDFRALFEAAPDPLLVLSPGLTIVAVNDAYLKATGTRREAIVGRELFAALDGRLVDPEAEGLADMRASLELVLARRQPDAMGVQRYDLSLPDSSGGGTVERHWSVLNSPVLDAAGAVECVIHRMQDVTRRVLLERQTPARELPTSDVARQAERYRALLETAPDAIVVVDGTSRLTFVNVQAEQMFGYSREELVGQRLELLVPEKARGAHARHVERFLADPGARPMGRGIELSGRRKDGTEMPIEVSLSPLRAADGVVVSAAIRDVSERKRTEAERRLAAERLASAVESIPDAFALFDARDHLVQCNSVYRRLIGESLVGPVVGKTYAEVVEAWSHTLAFDEEERRQFHVTRCTERRGNRAPYDVRTRDDRSLRVVDRRTAEGGLVQVIGDVSEDVRREKELLLAQRAAEEGNAAKTEFLSSVSHELRTPLNAVLGFAQLLQRDRKTPLDSRQEVRVGHIIKGGEHLLKLIDDILDLSRIEGRSVSMSIEAVSVASVLREVRSTIEPMAARAGIEVAMGELPDPLPMVEADHTRFAQVLMNYASNAVKYNNRGGRLWFEVALAASGRVRVTVADTGIGIPLDKMDRVFQPFQRAGQETGPIEGTGIGLAISKRLAELMRGTVGFESTPGVGSSFWIELPAHAATAVEAPAEATLRSPLHAGEGSHLVLYVEDNPANVEFMREFLGTFEALELVVASTAELGVAIAHERGPSVIIMDINLPGKSGLDALQELRASPRTRSIPVIALTASASDRDRDRGVQAGFFRYLTKPVKVAELETALAALLLAPG